jgi:hypothetical protein
MRIQDVRAVGKQKGIDSARMGKADIIRAIQSAEGNYACYGSAAEGICDQPACAWRDDCLAEAGRRATE